MKAFALSALHRDASENSKLTLNDDVHGCGSGSAASLHRADVLALVRQVHILNFDGELILVQSNQTHPGVHGPLILSGVQYTWSVEPRCVCHKVPLWATTRKEREPKRILNL